MQSKNLRRTSPFYLPCVDGNLALDTSVAEAEDNINEEAKEALVSSKKSSTRLRVLKPSKTVKVSGKKANHQQENNDWAEDKNMFKSPVFLIGMALAVMVTLILFW